MKITSRLALALVLLLAQAAPLNAGTVYLGMLDDSDSYKWACGEPVSLETPPSDSLCASAKFDTCAFCRSVAVINDSEAAIDVEFEVAGSGFSEAHAAGAFYGVVTCEKPGGPLQQQVWGPAASDNCAHLLPGKRCAQSLQFCPEQSGTSHGQVKVSVRGAGEPKATTFGLIGNANYTPELQAADEARRRHAAELMKIPHVKKVELDPRDDEILINVEVEYGKSLDQVRRAAPPKVEGYDVEVTTYIETGYAF